MNNKVFATPADAIKDIFDGAVVMLGGFGNPGLPQTLVKALLEQGVRNLTFICNTCLEFREQVYDIAALVDHGQVSRLITTFVGRPDQIPPVVDLWRKGGIAIEVMPQGILTERMRSSAVGLGGVFIPNGVGTSFERQYETRSFNGQDYIFVPPLSADFALIAAYQADFLGNLTYRLTQRNYNPTMASAADITIAEVSKLVGVGDIKPEHVITPGIYVDRLVVNEELI